MTLISGTEWFFKRREVQKAVAAARASGRVVVRAEGTDPNCLAEVLDSAGFDAATLAVVTSPNDVDFELLRKHMAADDNALAFLLYDEKAFNKNAGLAKFASELPKQHHIVFDKPDKAYKHEDYAIKFVVNEARRLGVGIDTDLAEALVQKVGKVEFGPGKFKPLVPDLGLLHFELLKVATYLSALGEGTKVTPAHLKATMAVLGEADIGPLADAVGKASVRAVTREMDRLSREHTASSAGDRTLKVCGWLGGQATKWLHAAALNADGASEAEASARMGVPPYIHKAFILPAAKRWGIPNLGRLIRTLASAETAVKSGHINPWLELESGLVVACKSAVGAG